MDESLLKSLFPTQVIEKSDQWHIMTTPGDVVGVAQQLKEHPDCQFACLLDLCVVDYLTYGVSEWAIENSDTGSYSRAVAAPMPKDSTWQGPRFVVVCHLLSLAHNRRIRLKIAIDEQVRMPTLSDIWPSSLWYEREAYDLFGVVFENHPDLRRLLTDYGFVGFPFRKDFPLVGTVEMRYDGENEQCIYEPVSIENRVGVPKVIREDNRYMQGSHEQG